MLDIIVLFTLFVVLVATLGLYQYLQRFSRSHDPAAGKKLLQEWLQAHKLELPDVDRVLYVLNSQLKQDLESEELEVVEMTKLLPQTELPVFSLYRAELSSDNTDVTLYCTADWPMCLPGVCVAVREKGRRDNVICHFSIDWMNAQMKIRLSDNDGDLLLGYENTQPFRMGVSCMMAEGTAKDPDRIASQVADALQLLLMNLTLDQVPLSPRSNHTPSKASSVVPLVFVSSADEVSSRSHDQAGDHRSAVQDVTSPSERVAEERLGALEGGVDTGIPRQESEQTIVASSLEHSPSSSVTDSPITPTTQEVEPSPSSTSKEVADEGDDEDEDILARRLPPPPSIVPSLAETDLINGRLPPLYSNQQSDSAEPPESSSTQTKNGGGMTITKIQMTPATLPGVSSSNWRRTPSYEQLEQIALEAAKDSRQANEQFKKRSSSSDHLASPTRVVYVSSPMGKKSLTLSMAGSEAESIYGADDRIPSTLVFEVDGPGNKLRHIIAMNTAHAIKLRRRYGSAKKLHIYNDHSFLASKLKNKTDCAFCKEKISKLFGKQGYVCRDCGMVVHKQCHYKVEEHCPSTSVASMNLVYPEDAATASN